MKEQEQGNGEKMPGRDPVERELHAIREEYARRFGYDVHAMFEDLREKQKRSGREVVSFPPKRVIESEREGAA